jgi:phospholipid transport system transporter-binding protein
VTVRLNTEDAGHWKVEGELTFASVPELQDESLERFASPPGTLDLAAVERIDSAGIALIIEWARRARIAGGDMKLVNVPAGMTSLSKTAGLSKVLNIDTPSS